MVPDIISAKELLLLCALRGKVEALNTDPYTQTILHSSHTLNRFNEMVSATEDEGENHDHFYKLADEEAKEKFDVYISEMRLFSIIGLNDSSFLATMRAL